MFYVLDGMVDVLAGDEIVRAEGGYGIVVPPGLPHAFSAQPGHRVELLIVIAPGVERFEYFRQLTRIARPRKYLCATLLFFASHASPTASVAAATAVTCLPGPTFNPLTAGTLTASLYTAPAGLTVTVTATSVNDPTQTAHAPVTSQILTLTLAPSAPSPCIAGSSANFVATVTSAITGANPKPTTAVTDSNGHATLSYAGAARGLDTIQATDSTFTSNALSATRDHGRAGQLA